MAAKLHLAVDLMGGDLGPRSTLPAAQNFAERFPDVQFSLVGLADTFSDFVPPSNVSVVHAESVVAMSDKPAQALRQKQDSSMWMAVSMVASGEASACVSAGNTGALMAMGKFLLKTFPGIDRPAICKPVPTAQSPCLLMDLGANVDCTAEQLHQFALMGSVLASAHGHAEPRVALLNVGEEETKGHETVRLAASMLQDDDCLNYVGFIEGNGIFEGDVDVVVCDGFVGNAALKSSEGAAKLLADELKLLFSKSWWGRLVGQIARPLLLKWHTKIDPARYNGASFLGLQGTVIKSHGGADTRSFECALGFALEQARQNIPQRINQQLQDYLA